MLLDASVFAVIPFQLTRPMRGATGKRFGHIAGHGISTHTPHAGRDYDDSVDTSELVISTHTPHAGRDRKRRGRVRALSNFNSHAPCGARRPCQTPIDTGPGFQLTRPMRGATAVGIRERAGAQFQLTRPMRGATALGQVAGGQGPHFNSHAPCGARLRGFAVSLWMIHYFNSHAPCGARQVTTRSRFLWVTFQLTRPMRGATNYTALDTIAAGISTHTPHAGRDAPKAIRAKRGRRISTHTPHAGRDSRKEDTVAQILRFQLTRPMRGATAILENGDALSLFQLTRPMRGATRQRLGR